MFMLRLGVNPSSSHGYAGGIGRALAARPSIRPRVAMGGPPPGVRVRWRSTAEYNWFDPAQFAATRLPLGQARCLPAKCFTSKRWLDRELKTVHAPSWQIMGRVDECAQPGDYMTAALPGIGPVVVLRGKDGQLRAFHNTCRHRGAVLLREERGKLRGGIVCPYHAWTYDTAGGLRRAPDMCKEFEKKDFPLHELRLDVVAGFVFVNASQQAPNLQESIGNLPELVLDRHPALEGMVTVARREYTCNTNWKFLFENTAETYHTSFVHGATLGPMTSQSVEDATGIAPTGNWDAAKVHTSRSVVPMPAEEAVFPVVSEDTHFVNVFPSVQINLTTDCAWWMRMLPTSTSTTRVTMGFLFPQATVDMDGFDGLVKPYLHRWDVAVREDNEISENQQDGAESKNFVPGPYSPLEFGSYRFDNFVLDRVLGVGQGGHAAPGVATNFEVGQIWAAEQSARKASA